jgi:hypothetical protein
MPRTASCSATSCRSAIVAKAYKSTSWFDQKPCIVLDYSKTSILASRIRDKIRLIAPNFHLGNVFWDKTKLFDFALEFPQPWQASPRSSSPRRCTPARRKRWPPCSKL